MFSFYGGHIAAQAPATSGGVYEPVFPPASDKYSLGLDSQKNTSVPEGATFTFELAQSKIFPDTKRKITIYVPAEYNADKPACVYVGLDGLGFRAPIVFDNLIAQHAMPVTIAIGVSPGVVAAAGSPNNPRFDRSLEFDTRSARVASFLLEEVLPAVEKQKTPSGKPILLSSNPDDRAIGGASTGGIGSFTVAWERPDAFHRVFLAIGTFVGMRGGEQQYVLVRKTEPKPLRIFMQDGVHDEWSGAEIGDWWMANQTMERALTFAGYDVQHVWGIGTHSDAHATAIFPEAMRWLWKDWPEPIQARPSNSPVLKDVIKPGEWWQALTEGCLHTPAIAVDPEGRVFNSRDSELSFVPDTLPKESEKCLGTPPDSLPFAVGPEGKRYRALSDGGIQISSGVGEPAKNSVFAKNLHIRDFTVRYNGDIYATVRGADSSGELWRITAEGSISQLKAKIKGAAGLAFSPDGLWLFVAQAESHLGLSFRVQQDGQLDAGEPFYDFAVPSTMDGSGAGSVAMDESGRAYVATPMGVQIFDRNGRVIAILPLPANEAATGICFGGKGLNILYVSAGDKIYRRVLQIRGASPWLRPHSLPPWKAG